MKWPRKYAEEIVKNPPSQWKGKLEEVPEWCRDWVRKYLVIEYERRRAR